MEISAEIVRKLVERELASVSDARVITHVRGLLVASPTIELRDWDYGSPGQRYPCWIVLSDAANSNTAIAYCEYGFGPKCPWGLLYIGDDAQYRSMGMDSGWYPTFLAAFFESFAAVPLPIWRVIKVTPDGVAAPCTDEGAWEKTWERAREMRTADPANTYYCGQSITAPY